MPEKNPRTLENKLKGYARVMLPVLGLSLLYGSCVTPAPYQPKKVESYTPWYSYEPAEKRETIELKMGDEALTRDKAKNVLREIINKECRRVYPLDDGSISSRIALAAADWLECWDYGCVESKVNYHYSTKYGMDMPNSRNPTSCVREDWVKRWMLDLDNILNLKVNDGGNLEVITKSGEIKSYHFKNEQLCKDAADIIYTFFCEKCHEK